MGSYDYRCLLTGMSLRGARCVAIVVQQDAHGWRPASIPIAGDYAGFGTIRARDRDDYLAAQMSAAFEHAVADRQITFRGDAKYAWQRADEPGFDRVLAVIERTATKHGSVDAAGGPLAHTLIQAPVFDAICAQGVAATNETNEPTPALLARALPTPFATWWYDELARSPRADVQTALRTGLAQILALDAWMNREGIAWGLPPTFTKPGEQHDERRIVTSIRAARKRFAGVPWLAPAIDEVAARIEQRSSRVDPWITGIDVSWYAIAIGERRLACTEAGDIPARLADAYLDPEELATAPAELLVIDRGDIAARIDLKAHLRVTDDGDVVVVDLEVPPLAPPLATPSDKRIREAMFLVPEPPPAWLTDDERYQAVIPFQFR